MHDDPSDQTKSQMVITELEMDESTQERELSRFQLLVLTCTLGGLQVVWSILNGNINVFLLSIGISASISPLIWAIAPLCGTFVQPLVGWMSDQSQSKYGRRKPYILVGTLSTVVSLLGLSFSHNIAQTIGQKSNEVAVTTAITVFWMLLMNVSIQPLQMGIRALVMDCCPKSQQPQANAWAGCAASVGNVFGYMISYKAASTSVHAFGFGHFKYLALIASLCLLITVAFNLWFSDEPSAHSPTVPLSAVSIRSLFQHLRRSNSVSSRSKIINQVQFCAWMGWFPFLFYMFAFVSDLSPQSDQASGHKSKTTAGALAGFLYALVSCFGSFVIPQLLRRTKYAGAEIKASSSAPIATLFGRSLEEVWCAGQVFFGCLMFSTTFAYNTAGGITLIALAGIPWALANYIPFALLGVEVAEQRSLQRESAMVVGGTDNVDREHETLGTGATIGLHNTAISAPQIPAALISAAVHEFSDKAGIQNGNGWVMRLSGIAALFAAWQIKRLFTT